MFRLVCVVGVVLGYVCVSVQLQAKTTIAFGSCIEDERPTHPIWDALNATQPDVMVFLGDNVYIDQSTLLPDEITPDIFNVDYLRLANIQGFQALRNSDTKIFAVWDDHDYGPNDGDSTFKHKDLAQKHFFDFWYDKPPAAASTPGIFRAQTVVFDDHQVQVILLDTRYFRSPWTRNDQAQECAVGSIVPSTDTATTLLGEAQWNWLERRFKESVDLHLVVSSIQVIPEEHCFERWGGMPHERERLLRLIGEATGRVVVLSGDRHLAEVSALQSADVDYLTNDLYEFTSSAMSSRVGFGGDEVNRFRVGEKNVRVHNFGLLTIDWSNNQIRGQFIKSNGEAAQTIKVKL